MSCDTDSTMSKRQLLERRCLNDGSMSVPVPVSNLADHWKEFVCGGGSAFCNILISYPLNKLIFRQILIKQNPLLLHLFLAQLFDQVTRKQNGDRKEAFLWRKASANFLAHRQGNKQTDLIILREKLRVLQFLFHSADKMMHGVEATFALNQLQKEGLGYLYRGMLPPLLQRSISMSLMFGIYGETLQPLLDYKVNPYLAKAVAGIVAGCFEAGLMPFERIQTLLIHPKYHKEFKNTAHAGSHIARYYGIKEFYRGLVPILFRNGPSNAMFFIIRDEVKTQLPTQESIFYDTLQNFIAGASIGAFLSTLFYPLNVIKIAMQCELGGPHRTMLYEFNYILRKRGSKFTNFYHGALLNISRAFLSWGIINASYEILRKVLYS